MPMHPALGPDGWVTSPTKKADLLISDFFLTDHSQTFFFTNGVSSFSFLLQKNQNNIPGLLLDLQNTLSTYFSKHFHNVDVQVTEKPNSDNSNQTGVVIYLVFDDDAGITHNLSHLVKYSGKNIMSIVAILNGA